MKKSILSLLVAVALVGSASASVLTGSLTNGLVSFYSFNGNANDSVGGNNATVYGATLTTGISGSANSAYYFNGSSAYMSASYTPTGNNAFTWSMWVNPVQFGGDNRYGNSAAMLIQSAFMDTQEVSPSLQLSTDGSIVFSSYDHNLTGDQNAVINLIRSTASLSLNHWAMITVSSDQYNQRAIYINGVLDKSGTSSGYGAQIANLLVGGDRQNQLYFNGSISEIAIWNTALTSQHVSALYSYQAIPEPSTYALFGLGAIGMLMVMRRKKTA
jgi:hypothetical protein